MSLTIFFEVILSLVVIYALLSILVSLLNEFLISITNTRGKVLFAELQTMLKDHYNLDYAYLLYSHPLVSELPRKNKSHHPVWIEASTFAPAFIQTIGNLAVTYQLPMATDEKNGTAELMTRFRLYAEQMQGSRLKDMLLNFHSVANGDYAKLEAQLKDWFNNQMASLTFEYKRKQRNKLLFFGFVITLFLNVDSIYLAQRLAKDPIMRTGVSSKSTAVLEHFKPMVDSLQAQYPKDKTIQQNAAKFNQDYNLIMKQLDSANVPLGYSKTSVPYVWFSKDKQKISSDFRKELSFMNVFLYLAGLAISMFSLSRGAPFWFELLSKFVRIKSGGGKS
ncbi:MAG: hypothetical protein JNK73_02830 [Bacteroidia bacterium]|nr:hypothetical protein [Bacteroidia bacterium]